MLIDPAIYVVAPFSFAENVADLRIQPPLDVNPRTHDHRPVAGQAEVLGGVCGDVGGGDEEALPPRRHGRRGARPQFQFREEIGRVVDGDLAFGFGAGALLSVDLLFVAANLTELVHGAWVPLLIGATAFTIMTTWQRGSDLVNPAGAASAGRGTS